MEALADGANKIALLLVLIILFCSTHCQMEPAIKLKAGPDPDGLDFCGRDEMGSGGGLRIFQVTIRHYKTVCVRDS